MMKSQSQPNSSQRFENDDQRHLAFRTRNRAADGRFIVAVKTTGIFCRPICPARPPKRENVLFFDDTASARKAGFRACKRCRPDDLSIQGQVEAAIRRADELASATDEPVKVAVLAKSLGLSDARLLRLFKDALGLTPKQFLVARATDQFQKGLRRGESVTNAIQGAGFSSFSRAYEAGQRFGVRPTDVRSGGEALVIRAGAATCELGYLAIGLSGRGLCALTFGNTASEALGAVRSLFPKAHLVEDAAGLREELKEAASTVSGSAAALSLPIDIRGTVFQEKVWKALAKIPRGQTRSYAEIAKAIGRPTAQRAVAQACGANRVAVLIPCHRVIGSDGKPGGYAYGVERKLTLLSKERKRS